MILHRGGCFRLLLLAGINLCLPRLQTYLETMQSGAHMCDSLEWWGDTRPSYKYTYMPNSIIDVMLSEHMVKFQDLLDQTFCHVVSATNDFDFN
jgi:hypothetical protein